MFRRVLQGLSKPEDNMDCLSLDLGVLHLLGGSLEIQILSEASESYKSVSCLSSACHI